MSSVLPAPRPDAHVAIAAVRSSVSTVIRGKDDVVDLALITLVASGHLLIEDIPGVGKSTLARTLAQAVGGEFRRIQFTSDLLPADLVGVSVLRPDLDRGEFRPGPLFANFVLADEINRAPPRTQSALLEAMGERTVSVDGTSHALALPFMVIATQNPTEHYGTYPLPESQRDRFTLRLEMGYVGADVEAELLGGKSEPVASTGPVCSLDAILAAQAGAQEVFVHPDLAAYAQRVIHATRNHAALRLGVSTRGGIAWMRAARARAWIDKRAQLTIDDLQELAVPALAHRLIAQAASDDGVAVAAERVREIVATTPVPR
jgi:MoxR-like ATPase